jgi:twinkle protein
VQSAVPTSHESPATTINWVLEQAVFAIERHGVDVLVIDPWNELEWAREKNETLTEYIGWCLKFLKYFARAHDVAVIVVAHPTKARVAGSGPVTLADIEGSAHWWNKSDNGLIVVREQGATKVISAKVREQGAGKLGACYFKVDPDTEQFFPMHGAVDVTG